MKVIIYISLIFFLPLFSFFISNKYLEKYFKNLNIYSILLIFYSFLLSVFLLIKMLKCRIFVYQVIMNPWINSYLFLANWGFNVDRLSLILCIIILFISLIVHIYSYGYMYEDLSKTRFFSYLSLFTFFMLILICSNNFIQMFIGWEGVSLSSYLLINFWYLRLQANKSALKAFFINRISDSILLFAFFIIFKIFRTFDFNIIFSLIPFIKFHYMFFIIDFINSIDLISLLLFFGAIGKSAQFFFHIWLPDAMEGPTPVSALIHSATMVTVGVFLIIRCSPIIEYSTLSLNIILFIGSFTVFFAGLISMFQYDIKKIIAFSTCSQLGYMFIACGISSYNIALFHLFNHSFFKALLFLSSGIIIHGLNNEQDIRRMGGLIKVIPYTYVLFLIGNLSLIGIPFLSGFYSKELIFKSLILLYESNNNLIYIFIYILSLFGVFFTTLYSIRLIFYVFIKESNVYKVILVNLYENSYMMNLSLILLALNSIYIGYFTKELFVGFGTDFFGNSFFILPLHSIVKFKINFYSFSFFDDFLIYNYDFFSILLFFIKLFFSKIFYVLPFYIILFTFYFCIRKILRFEQVSLNFLKKNIYLYTILNKKWFFDKIYNEIIIQRFSILFFSKILEYFEMNKINGLVLSIKYYFSFTNYKVFEKLSFIKQILLFFFFIFLGSVLCIDNIERKNIAKLLDYNNNQTYQEVRNSLSNLWIVFRDSEDNDIIRIPFKLTEEVMTNIWYSNPEKENNIYTFLKKLPTFENEFFETYFQRYLGKGSFVSIENYNNKRIPLESIDTMESKMFIYMHSKTFENVIGSSEFYYPPLRYISSLEEDIVSFDVFKDFYDPRIFFDNLG
jgi:NADH-quinone oxidoreductase subunit L